MYGYVLNIFVLDLHKGEFCIRGKKSFLLGVIKWRNLSPVPSKKNNNEKKVITQLNLLDVYNGIAIDHLADINIETLNASKKVNA